MCVEGVLLNDLIALPVLLNMSKKLGFEFLNNLKFWNMVLLTDNQGKYRVVGSGSFSSELQCTK